MPTVRELRTAFLATEAQAPNKTNRKFDATATLASNFGKGSAIYRSSLGRVGPCNEWRAHQTGGNRCGLTGLTKPVWSGFGLGRYQTGPNLKFKFEF